MKPSINLTMTMWMCGLIALSFGVLVYPNLASIQRLKAEKIDLKERVARSDDGAAKLRDLSAQLIESKRVLADETTPIPEDGDIAGLIRELTSRLESMNVREREITTGSPIRHEDASSMPMSVSMTGGFVSVFDTIQWAERLPRLVRVQRVKIKRPLNKDGVESRATGPVEADLLLDVMFAPRSFGPPPEGLIAGVDTEGDE